MKVLCVSFKENHRIKREALTGEIFEKVGDGKVDLLVLPGNFVNKSIIKKDGDWVKAFADERGISVIYESFLNKKYEDNHYAFHSKACDKNTEKQKFATSTQVDADQGLYTSLINEIEDGKRTFEVKKVKFGVIICGENNILKNLQSKYNQVRWRFHPPKDWKAKVILNLSHNTMGNWNKLNKRFEFLSRKYGWAIYLTNSSKKDFGKSSLRVYKAGKEVKNGNSPDFKSNDNNAIGCLI
jgi:hypothetical protein